MTTPSEALAKVRRALELGSTIEDSEADEALSLLPIIEGAMLPELPEGILTYEDWVRLSLLFNSNSNLKTFVEFRDGEYANDYRINEFIKTMIGCERTKLRLEKLKTLGFGDAADFAENAAVLAAIKKVKA